MKLSILILSMMLVLIGCAGDDVKEEAEIKQYENQPLQRDGDRLTPRRD
jgi:hypothetical protein